MIASKKNQNDICFEVMHASFSIYIYHFWNFLIFKCTWVYSSSSSKNKHIFLHLYINSINLKMSIYLSISKMCSSLFSRGNQACARIANAKRTTQSQDAALSAITDIDYLSPMCTMCSRPTCIRVSCNTGRKRSRKAISFAREIKHHMREMTEKG